MISNDNIGTLTGATVYDRDGDKVGRVGQVYLDTTTGQPTWVSVHTGLFGTSESFVPLESATQDGEGVRVSYEKAFIKDAPRVEADGELSDEEQDSLYSYYSLGSGGDYEASAGGFAGDSTVGTGTVGAGHDTSGPNTDDAMTRSEEQLHVGTERVATGRARLRKHIVTEQQTVTVPVEHEEVRLEREPITDGNVGAALDGPAISEEEHEVTLTEERPVVQKEAVPVERVRLGTETVVDNQQVTENVRKEEIEFDDDTNRGSGTGAGL